MANGFYCKVCGYQETEHDYREDVDNPEKVCDEFTLSKSDKKQQDKIDKMEMEFEERESRKGYYMLTPNGNVIDITG